jgi:hypothetical protein
MRRKIPGLLFLASLIILATGCRSIDVKETREQPMGFEPGEAVTVVLNYSHELPHKQARETEEHVLHCVERSLARQKTSMRLISADEFRAKAFTHLDFDSAPRSPQSFAILADYPLFKERTAAMGLRYIVVITGGTTSEHKWGDIDCVQGSCVGIRMFEKTTRMAAVILDLRHSSHSGEVTATVTGHPWFAMMAFLPVGFPAFTKGRACKEIGDHITNLLCGVNKQ